MKIKVVGIDPSLRNFGYAHGFYDVDSGKLELVSLDIVQTESAKKAVAKVVRKNSDDLERASLLFNGLQKNCHDATFAFVEIPVGSQSARAMASYGVCIGVLSSCPCPIFQLTPTEVKLAATGNKTASKEEMIEWAMKMYPNLNWLTYKSRGQLVPKADNEHLADAVAALHAGISGREFQNAMFLMRAGINNGK